jgi:hypothetical protein
MNGSNVLTHKWLNPFLIVIVFAAIGLIVRMAFSSISETRSVLEANTALFQTKITESSSACQAKIEYLHEKKVDKEQYYRDIEDIKDGIKSINMKIDRMRK